MIELPGVSSSETKVITPDHAPRAWDAYVKSHPKGTIFHTAAMHQVFEQTNKYFPFSRAVTKDGKIVAMLCAVRIATVGGIASSMASRSIWYAEPICDATVDGQSALSLLVAEHDREMRGKILFSEIRPIFETGEEKPVLLDHRYDYYDYLNYVVDLQDDEDAMLRRLAKSCRKQVRKCQNRGVTIQNLATHDTVDQMYELVKFSYDRSRVPLAGADLFHNALDLLGTSIVEIRIARYGNENVAAGIVLKFKDMIYAWYGGSHRITGLAPFSLLTWDEIRCGGLEGFRLYDFGGAGLPDEHYGPRDFKSRFGGELKHFGRYRKVDSPLKLTAATCAYQAVRGIKSLMNFSRSNSLSKSLENQ